MFCQEDILDERKASVLRKKSEEVKFPLDPKDRLLINDMIMSGREDVTEQTFAERQ